MANQIDPQQLLQMIQGLCQALDIMRLAVDTHIAATANDLQTMAHEVIALTAQVGMVSTDMQAIAQQLTTANQNRPESYVNSAPEWDGTGKSQEAHHFLAAFANWASSSGGWLNNWWPAVGNVGDPGYVTGGWEGDGGKWTQSVLGLMKGTTRTWALPYLKTITSGGVAFPNWMAFEDAFRKRFAPLDSAQSARDMLKTIKQGRGSVAEYITKFDQYSTLTGWSDADHRQRFYNGLDDHIKDLFALSERPKGMYLETCSLASDIDQRVRQQDAEKSSKPYQPVTIRGKIAAG